MRIFSFILFALMLNSCGRKSNFYIGEFNLDNTTISLTFKENGVCKLNSYEAIMNLEEKISIEDDLSIRAELLKHLEELEHFTMTYSVESKTEPMVFRKILNGKKQKGIIEKTLKGFRVAYRKDGKLPVSFSEKGIEIEVYTNKDNKNENYSISSNGD